jgi:hypothetical protein
MWRREEARFPQPDAIRHIIVWIRRSTRLGECNFLARNAAAAKRGCHIGERSRKWFEASSVFIPCVAADAAIAGRPALGRKALGSTHTARAAIARNSPPGANNITTRRAGRRCFCALVQPLTAALPAAAISRASGGARNVSPGVTRPEWKLQRRRNTAKPDQCNR